MLSVLGEPRMRFRADDVDKITHGEIQVEDMQTPTRQDFSIYNDITNNVVRARVFGIAMHGHCEIRAVFVADAFTREQSGHFHIWRGDRRTAIHPFHRRLRRVQHTA